MLTVCIVVLLQAAQAAPMGWNVVDLGQDEGIRPAIAENGLVFTSRPLWFVQEPVALSEFYSEPVGPWGWTKRTTEVSPDGRYSLAHDHNDLFVMHREYVWGLGWQLTETVLAGIMGPYAFKRRADVNSGGLTVVLDSPDVLVFDAPTGTVTRFAPEPGHAWSQGYGRTPVNENNWWVADQGDNRVMHCDATRYTDGSWDCTGGLARLPSPAGSVELTAQDINDYGTVVGVARLPDGGEEGYLDDHLWACAVQVNGDERTCMGGSVTLGEIANFDIGNAAINNHNFIVATSVDGWSPPVPYFCDLSVSVFVTTCSGGIKTLASRVSGMGGLERLSVADVNDAYQISGTAWDPISNSYRTVRLDPYWF
jgi:hypothetical protein